MASGNADKLKVLFLVSRDFGEFTRAIYFASEPEFDSFLLIRPSLYPLDRDILPIPFGVYETVADVLAAVERIQPDVIFLFSGYLFVHDDIFSFDDVEQLIRTLGQRGCPVFTSDPLFGWLRELGVILSATGELEVEPKRDAGDSPSPHPFLTATEMQRDQKRRFLQDFGRADALLGSLTHVYDLTPPPGMVSAATLIYSNRGMVSPAGTAAGLAEARQALGLDPGRPRWVFVMAGEEHRWLTRSHGNATLADALEQGNRFHDLLADQMYEALAQGRQPVLIAPPACTSEVALRSNPADGLILLPGCRPSWFAALLLEAEYVIYWNMFSNSLKLRVVNRLPFFLCETGHIGRSSPVLIERMARCYYVTGVPPFLDFRQPLDAEELARAAAGQEPMLRAMAHNLLCSPRPAEALRQFLSSQRTERRIAQWTSSW